MTAAVMNLPFQAGGAVALATGRTVARTAMWAGRYYFNQPLRNSGIAALLLLSTMAGANALYFQQHHHPAPLFGLPGVQVAEASKPAPAPVTPAIRPKSLPAHTAVTAAPAEAAVAERTIGTEDVIGIQKKLASFELFDAKVDGLFGPRTARAIKAFEQRIGRSPKGELTPDVVDLILTTASIGPAPKPEPLPMPDPLPQVTAKVETKVAAVTPAPLPAPTPLTTELQTLPAPAIAEAPVVDAAPVIEEAPKVTTRDLPDTPEEAVAIAADVANEVVQNVQALTAPTENANAVTKRVVQTVQVAPPPPAPAPAATEKELVAQVQRGLSSLGFLHTSIDGVAGEATAKAIRNFEVYYNYSVTGRVTADLVKLLVQNGAVI